jgi:L-lactate dehydrogenase complex protein LldE
MRVALFPTCVVDGFAPEVGVAAVRLLRRMGHEVSVVEGATCCGQPAWNSGQAAAAAKVARTTLAAIAAADVDAIVAPAGSCTTMIRIFWSELFHLAGTADDVELARAHVGRVFELSEFVSGEGLPPAQPVIDGAAYHRSCHMLRELHIETEPESLLDQAGTGRVTTTAEGRCCGFGGLFSAKLPEVSVAMADDVLDAAEAAGAREVVACDSSCLMQLSCRAEARGSQLRFRHLAQVLDEATR